MTMKLSDRKRFVRELTTGLKERLNKAVTHFPDDWDGHHIRALAAMFADDYLGPDCVMRAKRQIRRSAAYYEIS